MSPIFPVTDLPRALAHYAALGCMVSTHDDGYGFAARARHRAAPRRRRRWTIPADGPAAAYLHVPDADALAAEWAARRADRPPVDTDYGLREGWHVDPDGNLLRFGSPLASACDEEIRWGSSGRASSPRSSSRTSPSSTAPARRGRLPVDRPGRRPSPPGTGSSGATAPTPSCSPTRTSTSSTSPPRTRSTTRSPSAAIRAGKALLVEKTFTATTAGAPEVVDLARESGVFVMEAMWTRFQPAVVALRDLIADGAIGEVRSVQADLGVAHGVRPPDRMFDLALGGGALLDLGVYVVSFAQMLLGTPERVVAAGSLFPSGADAEASLLLDYGDGRTATLMTSLRNALPGQAASSGRRAGSTSSPASTAPTTIVLHRAGAEPRDDHPSAARRPGTRTSDRGHRVRAVGPAESAVMPLADTLAVQALLERRRRAARRPARRGPRRPPSPLPAVPASSGRRPGSADGLVGRRHAGRRPPGSADGVGEHPRVDGGRAARGRC